VEKSLVRRSRSPRTVRMRYSTAYSLRATTVPVDTLACQLTPAFLIPPISKIIQVDSARVAGIVVNEQVAVLEKLRTLLTSTIWDGPALRSLSFLRINVIGATGFRYQEVHRSFPLCLSAGFGTQWTLSTSLRRTEFGFMMILSFLDSR
jgi:hypothetical protein